jgi:MFS family permease
VNRRLAGLILASALVTFDGTAVTLALPAISRTLGIPNASLHWLSDAPLLALALLLLFAGGLADRYGRYRMMRWGLLVFASGAALAAVSVTGTLVIAGRAVQGIGAACILPSAFALIRATIDDPERQTRKFGVLAAWTGGAAVAGPLIGGAFADIATWRVIFVMSAGLALAACAMLWNAQEQTEPSRNPLLPAQLIRQRNCIAANLATFGLYFGVFGLPFAIVVYLQQVMGYSALSASLAILPLSIMMFFAAPFAKLSPRVGSRRLIALGSVVATAGAVWLAAMPGALPFWLSIVVGTALFGLGVSIAVSPLTQAAVASVSESCAGAASALNHAVVRAAGLAGIAWLGTMFGGQAHVISAEGFQTAMSMCGIIGGSFGLAGAFLLRNDEAGTL